jgi:hypothetical protein
VDGYTRPGLGLFNWVEWLLAAVNTRHVILRSLVSGYDQGDPQAGVGGGRVGAPEPGGRTDYRVLTR